jgi:hypothetical protein
MASHPTKQQYFWQILSLQMKCFPLTISVIQLNAVWNSRWLATTSEYRDGKRLVWKKPRLITFCFVWSAG